MVAGVVLAAGLSSRMGKLKATLPINPAKPDDETFLTRILRTLAAAGVADVVVVVGHESDTVIESVRRRRLTPRFVVNAEYRSGQFSSLLAGLRAIDRPLIDAMLLTLVDVPLIAPSTVRAVVERFEKTHAPIVRPVADENGVKGARHGHPVLIARVLFQALLAADPAAGAKPIVRAHVSDEGNVEVNDEGAFRDVDTPDAYRRIFGLSE